MLPSVQSLANNFLALPEVLTSEEGATDFINTVADYINQVQAGPTGTPGILIYNRPPAIAAIEVMRPVDDDSWIPNLANAIHLGVTSGTLVPGTVTDPSWTYSIVDVETPVITTLSSALSTLTSSLYPVTSGNNPPIPLAQAIANYALAFSFLCTGLVNNGTGGSFPLPLTFSAE